MVQTRSKGKKRAINDELSMDREDMFRIIDETDILDGSLPPNLNSKAFKIVRPSELDSLSSSVPVAAAPQPARKLVELIDDEEATVPAVDDGDQETPLPSPFEDPSFRMMLCQIVFSTLWLCL